MKKLLFVAAVAFLALGAACGCAGGESDTPNVLWQEQEGAVGYTVYRAPTRFGQYELVCETDGAGCYDPEYTFGAYYKIVAEGGDGTLSEQLTGGEIELFGEDTVIISPEDDQAAVQAYINAVYSEQEEAHFTSERRAFFFKPGVYGDAISLPVGYYTTYAGLGRTADAVSVKSLECSDEWNTNALINFWRGAENLSVRNSVTWAVSQGTYLRNIYINGNLRLWDTSSSSGGFVANCHVTGTVESGSQQQFLSRNSSWGRWTGQLWNMVFLGVGQGSAPVGGWEEGKWNTVIPAVPVIREKPYLIFEDGEYKVFVPSLRREASGLYSAEEDGGARVIPVGDFFVAKPSDSAKSMNEALSQGKHLLFTPGIYTLEEPLRVERANTVVLGTGLATLVPANGEACMICGDAEGITVAGILFDAADSRTLLQMGTGEGQGNSENPSALFDTFFRVGGASDENTRVDTCLEVYADDVILDNTWLWRADHGYRWREQENSSAGVGWEVNRAKTGIAVYGDRVSAYGLFSEHFQGHNAYWAGNEGNVVFFQSEIAYDIPALQTDGGTDGGVYSSFCVAQDVTTFKAAGMGIYSHFLNGGVVLDSAVQVPDVAGVTLKNVVAVALSALNDSHMSNVINGVGGIVAGDAQFVTNIKRVLSYAAGIAQL